ncbi:MAG: hypothetical protein ACOY4I_11645 [Bacillota bacterium]
MKDEKKEKYQVRKIRLGRLAVDPVFLAVFLFFMFSSLLLMAFMLLSAR